MLLKRRARQTAFGALFCALGVIFLYLADDTSPIDAWEKAIPAISGEHYRGDQSKRIYWGNDVYPTYIVYDRKGKQIARFVDFPGVNVLKTTIEKGLLP